MQPTSHHRLARALAGILVVAVIRAAPAPRPRPVQPAPTFLPQAVGAAVHVQLERSVLTVRGPLATAIAFDLVRSSPTSTLFRRTDATNAVPVALVLRSDDTLAIADVAHARSDPDFADVLNGLNLARAAVRGAGPAPWTAPVAVAVNTTPAVVAFDVTRAPDGGYAFVGDGTVPRASSDADAVSIVVHVEGRAARGRIERIAVVQTRAVDVAFAPYLNVARWSFRFTY